MLAAKTLLILGAGASRALNFPLGAQLRDEISQLTAVTTDDFGRLSGPPEATGLISNFRNSSFSKVTLQEAISASMRITNGIHSSPSVDHFINSNETEPAIQAVCKAAISKIILESERNSDIFISHDAFLNSHNFVNSTTSTWYHQIWQMISSEILKSNHHTIFDKLTVINFNYDRTFEQYITHRLMWLYGLSVSDAESCVKRLNIIRPYGSVGPTFNDENHLYRRFGEPVSLKALQFGINSIKTFTESVDDLVRDKINNFMHEADTIIFLGYGYHPQNNDLLFNSHGYGSKRVYATALGQVEFGRTSIKNWLGQHLRQSTAQIFVEAVDSEALLTQYQYGLHAL